MTTPSVYAETLLQRQVSALEAENTHLKDRLVAAADEIARRDQIIRDKHWMLTHRSPRW